MQDELPIDDPDRRRLPPLLRQAWFSLNQAFRRRLSGEGITPDQFTALRWIRERDGERITQKDLADLMSSDPNTITSLVGRMESAGLISRKICRRDRRAKDLHITNLGRETFKRARQLAVELQMEILADLTEEEASCFLKLLEKVSESASLAAGRQTAG